MKSSFRSMRSRRASVSSMSSQVATEKTVLAQGLVRRAACPFPLTGGLRGKGFPGACRNVPERSRTWPQAAGTPEGPFCELKTEAESLACQFCSAGQSKCLPQRVLQTMPAGQVIMAVEHGHSQQPAFRLRLRTSPLRGLPAAWMRRPAGRAGRPSQVIGSMQQRCSGWPQRPAVSRDVSPCSGVSSIPVNRQKGLPPRSERGWRGLLQFPSDSQQLTWSSPRGRGIGGRFPVY